ncbi:MAG TPA: DUF1330 domain-containing protein [Chloroflexota bacterium]|nr:DUF1330 domain-containing protein [Chloroflexota bacterium]
MAKAYWVNTYRAILDPAAFQAYAQLAGAAVQAGGGRFLIRGTPAEVFRRLSTGNSCAPWYQPPHQWLWATRRGRGRAPRASGYRRGRSL